ncbi:MAG: VanZ family protein [Acidobacteriota bacterium]
MVDSKKAQAVVWALLTATLLLMPGLPEGSGPDWIPAALKPVADKVLHAFLFLVLVLLTNRAVRGRASSLNTLGSILVLLVGFVVLLEVGQLWVPNRTFDPADILAGLAGILLATLWILAKFR